MIPISTRNVLPGKITRIYEGTINDEIEVTTVNGQQIIALATKDSVASLDLRQGKDVYAFIKAPWVILASSDGTIHSSARNQLEGSVVNVIHGAVNAEVSVELAGKTVIHAVVTNESAQALNLAPGSKVTVLIMASHVLLGVVGD
jgi:molybdate transport system regulatory protein